MYFWIVSVIPSYIFKIADGIQDTIGIIPLVLKVIDSELIATSTIFVKNHNTNSAHLTELVSTLTHFLECVHALKKCVIGDLSDVCHENIIKINTPGL